jgi:hypothetical protein
MIRFALHVTYATMLIGSQPLAADYLFALHPEDGQIFGEPGQTIGWGYTLSNFSATDWLVPVTLDAGLFSHSVPESFFSFPILPPGTQVDMPFDLFTAQGLYAITWDLNAPNTAVEAGEFVLRSEWWSDDPFAGGMFLQNAEAAEAVYRAQIGAAVPEPATWQLMGAAGLLAAGCFLRRRE